MNALRKLAAARYHAHSLYVITNVCRKGEALSATTFSVQNRSPVFQNREVLWAKQPPSASICSCSSYPMLFIGPSPSGRCRRWRSLKLPSALA